MLYKETPLFEPVFGYHISLAHRGDLLRRAEQARYSRQGQPPRWGALRQAWATKRVTVAHAAHRRVRALVRALSRA